MGPINPNIFFNLGEKEQKGKATLEREIFEGINGEGFDEVNEFLGDPMMFLFMLLLCGV